MDEYGFFGEDMDDEEAEEERRHRTPGSRKRSKEATAVRRGTLIRHRLILCFSHASCNSQ